MSDGMIGSNSIAIPDLIEPVIGFRNFKVVPPVAAIEERWEKKWVGVSPHDNPFVEPNEYVTDPVSGKLIKNYKAMAEAYSKWLASLGEEKMVKVAGREAAQGFIGSPYTAHVWDDRPQKAYCTKGKRYVAGHAEPHASPMPNCQCGFYSYYDADKVHQSLGSGIAVGIVSQWGRIEAHATGMRSEYMKIEALFVYGHSADWIREEYPDIPIIRIFRTPTGGLKTTMEPIAKEFGSPLPESMRPKEIPPQSADDKYLAMYNKLAKQRGYTPPYSLKNYGLLTGTTPRPRNWYKVFYPIWFTLLLLCSVHILLNVPF